MLPGLVYMFGDSVARGIILDENGSYSPISECFGNLAAGRLGVELVNKSRFGCTITKGREILGRFLERFRTDTPGILSTPAGSAAAAKGVPENGGEGATIALLEFGGNDCDFRWDQIAAAPAGIHAPATPVGTFVRIYAEMVAALRAKHIVPVLMTLPPLDADRYFAWFTRTGIDGSSILRWLGDVQQIYRWHERYNDAIWKTALDNACPVVDIRGAFLEQRNYRDFLCKDGIHPNRAGHRLIESVLIESASAATA